MKRFLSVSVALALLTMPALAAEVPAETHTQAASELISIINLERTMMGGATAMVDAMQQQDAALVPHRDTILQVGPEVPDLGSPWAQGGSNPYPRARTDDPRACEGS